MITMMLRGTTSKGLHTVRLILFYFSVCNASIFNLGGSYLHNFLFGNMIQKPIVNVVSNDVSTPFNNKLFSKPTLGLPTTCGQTTFTDTVFNSPGYPAPDINDRACTLKVIPHVGVCGVRVRVLDGVFTDRLCQDNFLLISGAGAANGGSDPICWDVSGYSFTVPLYSRLIPKEVNIVVSYRGPFRFKLEVQLVKCIQQYLGDFKSCGTFRLGKDMKSNDTHDAKTTVTDIKIEPKEEDASTKVVQISDNSVQTFADLVTRMMEMFRLNTKVISLNNLFNEKNNLNANGFEDINERIFSSSIIIQDPFADVAVNLPVANTQNYPWTARVELHNGGANDGVVICGGTLIATDLVLTSATCVWDRTVSQLSVTVTDGPLNARTKIDVIEVRYHYAYRDQRYSRNLAVLKLVNKITTSPTLRPICLPRTGGLLQRNAPYTGIHAGHDVNGIFRGISLNVANTDECFMRFPGVTERAGLLCAQSQAVFVPHFQCPIEEGGGLVSSSSGQYLLEGVHSSGSICAFEESYAVYTRVSDNLDWIKLAIIG